MTYRSDFHTEHVLSTSRLVFFLVLATAMGCGSDGGGNTAEVDSDLLGIYMVDNYQSSLDCTDLMDAESASRLVLYSSLQLDPDRPVLVGQFCGSIESCRAAAEEDSRVVSYSFFGGDDVEGWIGYGIADQGTAGDQCRVEVQVHSLTASSGQSITIDTEQVETIFEPTVDENNVATCSNRDAIDAVNDNSPCTSLFLLEASFETGL